MKRAGLLLTQVCVLVAIYGVAAEAQAPAVALQVPLGTTSVLLFGGVGALAPDIVRIYNLRETGEFGPFTVGYLLASLGMAVIGAVVALALPATTTWSALYAGIAAPAIISTVVRNGGGGGDGGTGGDGNGGGDGGARTITLEGADTAQSRIVHILSNYLRAL
jgi:hypothetical protein